MRTLPHIALVSLVLAGCSQSVSVIDGPDAGGAVDTGTPPPPPPRGPHCELAAGATWSDLGSPASVEPLLPSGANVVAMHGGVIAAAGRGVVYVTEGATWRALDATGLGAGPIDAMTFHAGTWFVAQGAPTPTVLRYDGDATGWSDAGMPGSTAPVYALYDFGTSLLSLGADGLFEQRDATPGSWRLVPFGGDLVGDAVVSGSEVYVVTRSATTGDSSIQRSSDLGTWETVAFEAGGVAPEDLEAGGGEVIATGGLLSEDGYWRLDATTDTFVAVATPDGIQPRWLADDGAVMGTSRGETYFAPALGGTWAHAPMVWPTSASTGLANVWHVASEGGAIVIGIETATITPFGVPPVPGTRVIRSDDHGRSFANAASALEPAEILDVATDGSTLVVHVRGDLRDAMFIEGHVMTLEADGSWMDRSSALESLAFAGVSGLDGVFVTRPSEYAQVPPQVSHDGAHSWARLGESYPTYDTNASWAVRRASSFATDPEGRLYVATLGGVTSLCCDGTKTPWDYRPGSGVWRTAGGIWQPVNAGMPIAAPPAPSGGAPFRSDVESITWTPLGMLASLDGRGVVRLVGDRWQPDGAGIPVDVAPLLGAVADTAYAVGGGALYVLDHDVWIPVDAGAGVTTAASRADLLVRVADDGLATSNDAGGAWTALPASFVPHELAIARDRLYATDTAQHVHAIAITCTEAM